MVKHEDPKVRPVVDSPRDPWWQETHDHMGCTHCKFADKDMLGRGPVCNHYMGPRPDNEGRCTQARED